MYFRKEAISLNFPILCDLISEERLRLTKKTIQRGKRSNEENVLWTGVEWDKENLYILRIYKSI